jgi:predicted transcriptional regulator
MWEVPIGVPLFDVPLKKPSALNPALYCSLLKLHLIMEKITDVLGRSHPQFNTIAPTATVKDALYKMYCEHIDYLIVLENEKFVGLLTEHDVAGKVLFSDKPLQNTLVKEFMTTQVPMVADDDALEYGMQLLEHHNARYLAVYEGFTFKAIVSAQDLMRLALKERQSHFANAEAQQR